MSTAGDIRGLMQDVVNACEDRLKLLADLSKTREDRSENVSGMLLGFSQERQEIGKRLKKQLQDEIRRLQDETRQRSEDVTTMLLGLSQERQEMGRELRSRLQDETRRRGEDVSTMLLGFSQELKKIREDQVETAAAWQELVVAMQAKREVKLPVEEVRPVEEVAALPVEEAPPQEVKAVEEEDSLEDQVLKVISQHPEGIKLFDIGDHLSKDWRTFISAAKTLVEEGRVRKEDILYYPISS